MGKGQSSDAGINYSRYSQSVQLGFTEPYLFDKQILLGGDIFRRDYNSFNFDRQWRRNTTYSQTVERRWRSGSASRDRIRELRNALFAGPGQYHARQGHASTPIRTAPARSMPECDPLKAGTLSVRRNRQAD